MIRLGMFLPPEADHRWHLAAQAGITHAVCRIDRKYRTDDLDSFAAARKSFADAGFELYALEGDQFDMSRIKLGLPGRDEDLERYRKMLRNMGELGLRILCYNIMAGVGWFRSRSDIPYRGGAHCGRVPDKKLGTTNGIHGRGDFQEMDLPENIPVGCAMRGSGRACGDIFSSRRTESDIYFSREGVECSKLIHGDVSGGIERVVIIVCRGRSGGICVVFGHGLGHARLDFRNNPFPERSVVLQSFLGLFGALSDLGVSKGEPGAALVDDLHVQRHSQDGTGHGDAFIEHDVELAFLEGCSQFVFGDFDLDLVAQSVSIGGLDGGSAADFHAH